MKCPVCTGIVEIGDQQEPLWIAYEGDEAMHMACADSAVSALLAMTRGPEGVRALAQSVFRIARTTMGIESQ